MLSAKEAAKKAKDEKKLEEAQAREDAREAVLELSKECAGRKKRELKLLKKAEAAIKARLDYEVARRRTNTCVKQAKDNLSKHKLRIPVECIFCVKKPENVNSQDVIKLLEQYDDLLCEGFHCRIGTHKRRVHEIIGDRRCSCCEMPYSKMSEYKRHPESHLYNSFAFDRSIRDKKDNSEDPHAP